MADPNEWQDAPADDSGWVDVPTTSKPGAAYVPIVDKSGTPVNSAAIKTEPEATPEEEKPGLLKQLASAVGIPTELKDLAPETGAGAFGHGVQKGVTLGFGDELTGLLDADAKQGEERTAISEGVADAKRRGTYDPSAAAPDIPRLTSYTLKRPGQADVTKTSLAAATKGGDPSKPGYVAAPFQAHAETESAQTPWADAYRQARDDMRKKYKTAEEKHPALFTAGEFAGGAAVPLPGAGATKGLGKVAQYAATGAGLGTVAGLGNSNADLTKGEVGQAAADTGWGTAGGLASGALLGYGASKLDPWFEKKAAESAFKSLDPYMETIRKELGPDATRGEILAEARRLGQRTLDENIIPGAAREGVPFDFTGPSRWANSETLAERALQKTEEAGQLKGATVDMAQDALTKAGVPNPVSIGRLASNIEQAAEAAKLDGNQDLARKLMKRATDLRQTIVDRASAGFTDPAAQTLQEAEKFKTGLQRQVDYGAALPKREAQTAVARLAKEQAENAIEKGLGPDELEQFRAVKNRFGDLKSISNIANHGAVRSFRNNTVGLGDKIAAGAALAHGGPAALPAAAAAGAAHHFANHRGAAGIGRSFANAAQRMSPALTPAAEFASEPDDEDLASRWQSFIGEKK